ncbi:hypothetical protein ACFYO0_45655 [Streptomyces sp. NPDC006365]|uniref:hypothetical protein n=1 Tax=Streptomyces sp. NPDC006365 TaxID=3364744 RepID=UPI0036932AAA
MPLPPPARARAPRRRRSKTCGSTSGDARAGVGHLDERFGRSGGRGDLDPALSLLEDHGYVRAQPVVRTGGRDRPPSPRYPVHPRPADPTA